MSEQDSVIIKTYKAITQSNSSVDSSKITGSKIITLTENFKPSMVSEEDLNKLKQETNSLTSFIEETPSKKYSQDYLNTIGANNDGSFSLNGVFPSNKIRRIIVLKRKHNYLNQNRTSLAKIDLEEYGRRVYNDWISEDKIGEYVFRLGAVNPEDLLNHQRNGFRKFDQDFSRKELRKAYSKKILEIRRDLSTKQGSVAEEEEKPLTEAWNEIKKRFKEQGINTSLKVVYKLKDEEEKKNTKKNTIIDFNDPDFKLIKDSEEEKVTGFKKLEDNIVELVDLQEHVLGYYKDVNPENFVTAGIKRKFIGEKSDDSFFGRRVSNIWETLKVMKRRFKGRYHGNAKHIQDKVKDFSEGELTKKDKKFKKMLKLLDFLIEDFDLKKLGGLGLFKDFSLEDPRNMEGIFKSFYFIIDGTGFSNQKLGNNPRTSGSILEILKEIKTILTLEQALDQKQKDRLRLLTDLFKERVNVRDLTEGFEEKTIFQNNNWFDNWHDLFRNKLEQGFTAQEIVDFNLRVSDFGRSPNFERNKIRVKNFEDLFLSLQFFFKGMNKIVQTRTLKLDDVRNQWHITVRKVTDFLRVLQNFKEWYSQSMAIFLTERNKLFSEYASLTLVEIIKREQELEVFYLNFLNEILVKLYGEESLFVLYFSKENSVITEQLKLLKLTQLDEDNVYVDIVNLMKKRINDIQDLIMTQIRNP